MKKCLVLISILLCGTCFLWAQDTRTTTFTTAGELIVESSDIRLVSDPDGGYHLYVRKKPGINSIMLVETTKDPTGQEANYAYRAAEWNAINGDEKRVLNGEFLNSQYGKYSLMDSTPESDDQFGQAFHIYIPETILYGYPWSRNGEVHISMGTFINIRSFEKPYGDYSGSYTDNPFMFNFVERRKAIPRPLQPSIQEPEPEPEPEPVVELTDDYNPLAAASFEEVSSLLTYSKGPETIVDDIMEIIDAIEAGPADIVFAVDATGSMQDDIARVRRDIKSRLEASIMAKNNDVRIGLLLYRDYVDNFRYRGLPLKIFPFTTSVDEFMKNLNSFKIIGSEGGDIPEAVYEALYGAVEFYDWRANASRHVILIGDAEPHPKPRGTTIKATKELVEQVAERKGVTIEAIITPDDKAERRYR